jgi:vitamin B12 transporter
MYPPNSRRAAVLLACAFGTPAFAQNSFTSPTELDPIIVTATRSPEPLQATIGDNSVVTRSELDQLPNATLAEVLGRQRGISFVTRGGPQALTTVNVRGTSSSQSLVLVDGMRVNSPTDGLPVLNAIATNAIERIEIVRGAASSLYGADAIGGVINVITRKPTGDSFNGYANAGVGSYSSSEYNAGLSGSTDKWSYSLYGGYGQSAGFNATNSDIGSNSFNSDRDSYYRSNVGAQVSLTWQAGQTLSLQTNESNSNSGFDAYYFTQPQTPFNDRGIQTLSNTILSSSNQINDRWLSNLSVSYVRESYETEVTNDSNYDRSSEQYQYQWLNTIDLANDHRLTVGFERLEQSVAAAFGGIPTDYENDSTHTNSVFAVYTGTWGIQQIQASVRNDTNSQYGDFATGSLAYALNLTKQWQVSAAINTAYKAPSFVDLYFPFGAGNPNLKPEQSRNIELGLRYEHNDGVVALTGFYNRIQDLIVADAPLYYPENIQQATIRGLSLWAEQNIGTNTVVGGSFDFLSPYNNSTGELLPFIAQRTLKLNASHRIQDVAITADWLLTSRRRDGLNTLGGYGLFNLGASYTVNQHLELQLQWNNVLDKNYTLVRGYNTPGSNVFFNVKASY